MNKGLFISFEGGEGCGKTTLLKSLATYYQELNPLLTREPGGCEVAEAIRNIIINYDMDAKTECLLFAASRREHILQTIIPALNAKRLIFCDRFVDSSIAYQGYGRELGTKSVSEINNWVLEGLYPDIVIYLQLDPSIGIKRISTHRQDETNRLDQEQIEFHHKVKAGFDQELVGKEHVYVIDASQDQDAILQEVITIIDKYVK